jgi:hypothetical protein
MAQQRRLLRLGSARAFAQRGDPHRIVAVERDVRERRRQPHAEAELAVLHGHRHRRACIQQDVHRNLALGDEPPRE